MGAESKKNVTMRVVKKEKLYIYNATRSERKVRRVEKKEEKKYIYYYIRKNENDSKLTAQTVKKTRFCREIEGVNIYLYIILIQK